MTMKKIFSLLISLTILLVFSISSFVSNSVFGYPNGWQCDDDVWVTEDEMRERGDDYRDIYEHTDMGSVCQQ